MVCQVPEFAGESVRDLTAYTLELQAEIKRCNAGHRARDEYEDAQIKQ